MNKEDEERIKSLISEVFETSLGQLCHKMLGMSESLLKMQQDLSQTIDRHLQSLEKSRDLAQETLKMNIQYMERLREDQRSASQGYRDELQSAKTIYNALLDENRELVKKLAEHGGGGTHVNVVR